MSKAVADKSRTIRLSAGVLGKLNTIHEVERDLAARLQRDPSVAEIADAAGLKASEVEAIRRWALTPVSFDHPAAEDERRRADEDRRDRERDDTGDAPPAAGEPATPGVLSEVERRVLELRHGTGGGEDPLGVAEVADRLGLTPEAVRQIETDGIAKLQRQRASG
jgi:DNA-directed RNA polymerase sigma subunit (sigma70/sigma32)